MSERLTEGPSQFAINLEVIRNRPDISVRIKQAAEAFGQLTDLTPGDYSDYWSERWELLGTIVGSDIAVPRCDRDRGEIQELREQGRTLIVRPEDLTLPQLGEIYPKMRSWSVLSDTTVESDPRFGWLDIADVTRAPNLRTNVSDLKRIAQETRKHGMTEETYIIGSQDHFDRTGEYFDHGYQTYSRLLGSRRDGGVLDARFGSGGGLDVDSSWHPARRYPFVGGRLEGVK